MIVTKGHKILLNTTPEQDRLFTAWCGTARWAYNFGLEQKIKQYRTEGKSPSAYGLMKQVVAMKRGEEHSWLAEAPCSVVRVALLQLDAAYGNFFRRAKKGEGAKSFPRFKSKKRSKLAFHLEPQTIGVDGRRLRIPKMGCLKMSRPIRFEGKVVGTVCVSKLAGRWYASFQIETEVSGRGENQVGRPIGLDVGIKHLAVLSNGQKFENPKATYRLQRLLARVQRQAARKQKESARKAKALLRVQKIHKRIADVRADATHKVSRNVSQGYAGVAIETLNVAGMVKNRHLAKAISDANFNELHRQLAYKMAWCGGEVRRAERFFPSSRLCSQCGAVNETLTLNDREWTCNCGARHDRDVNAAVNLVNVCWPMASGRCAGTDRPM